MIENKSVKILERIKFIWLILLAVSAVAFLITGIIGIVNADSKAMPVVTLIFGLIGMAVGGYLVYLAFDFLINRRQENINYMNARLNKKHEESNTTTHSEVK